MYIMNVVLCSEDGGDMFLRNFGNRQQDYIVS
jgi:hypothetical protein